HVDAFVADASELGLGTLQPIGAIHERSAEGFAVLVDS
ncbi:MAG: hypothetical protein RLZZ150_378, partial [Bacteroidota bacterium]